MFSRIIKNFFLKRKIYKKIESFTLPHSDSKIASIGLLVDESYFLHTAQLIEEICTFGFQSSQIELLCFLDKKKKGSAENKLYFTYKDIAWSGTVKNEEVLNFTVKSFDLLISYYDIEKAPLLAVSFLSKAKFKIGFQTINKKVNHLVVNEFAENYKTFISEVFKYLKIINKI